MLENLTNEIKLILSRANAIVHDFNHDAVEPEHILLALTEENSGPAHDLFKELGVDLEQVRLKVEKLIIRGPGRVSVGKFPHSLRTKKVLEYAIKEARDGLHAKTGEVNTKHLLLGLTSEECGVASEVLRCFGVRYSKCF